MHALPEFSAKWMPPPVTISVLPTLQEAYQAQAHDDFEDTEFPALDWKGWRNVAEKLGILGAVDSPIFRQALHCIAFLFRPFWQPGLLLRCMPPTGLLVASASVGRVHLHAAGCARL